MRLFDTGFIIDLVNLHPGAVRFAKEVDAEASLSAISAVTVHEYLFGVHFKYRSDHEELSRKVASAANELERFETIPFTKEIAETSSRLQAVLTAEGGQLGINDLYIAATAIYYGLPLVTRNVKDFRRIPQLKLERY